jgi:hypothetical protein
MTITPKKPQIKKLKKADITDEMRRKAHACDHDKVGYAELNTLAVGLYKRSKEDADNIKKLSKILTWQKKHIEDLKKINEILVDKYEDALETQEKELQECHKDKNDITRAYNGLHSLGKFAEDQGIDIKKACKDLPENQKNKYQFKQKHSLLESGKVSHEYFFGKKKNGKGPK